MTQGRGERARREGGREEGKEGRHGREGRSSGTWEQVQGREQRRKTNCPFCPW